MGCCDGTTDDELVPGADWVWNYATSDDVSGWTDEIVEAWVGTTLLAGDLKKHMDEFDKISLRADAALLILPDWLAAVTVRELRLRRPAMPIYASDWAVSPRTTLLAGALGEGEGRIQNTLGMTPAEYADNYNLRLYQHPEEMVAQEKLEQIIFFCGQRDNPPFARCLPRCSIQFKVRVVQNRHTLGLCAAEKGSNTSQ